MWNDKETDVDLLGHVKIAETVTEIINDHHLRPLTIGVYGDWGVGKSSVLSLLQQQIKKSNDAKVANSHCITFNGWLFQGYEDAKTALMETIVMELGKKQPGSKKVKKLVGSLLKRVNWLKLAKISAGALFTGLTGIPDPTVLGGLVGFMKKGKDLIAPEKETEGGTNVTVESGEDDTYLKDAEKETITNQIHAFRQEFKELIEESKVDHIVVLVDDLDRCLPKSVIDILEAIRLFLFVEGTTFIISADEQMIEYAVREHFPNLPASYSEYTRNYLEKLIQIPIRIPTLTTFQTANYIKFLMLQNYLKHDFTKLAEVYNHHNSKKKTPYDNVNLSYQIITEALGTTTQELQESILVGDQLSPTLSIGLKGNPRNTKRFLNTLFLRLKIARIYGLDSVIKLNILAKLMLLERFNPEKYEALVNEVSVASDGISASIGIIEKANQEQQNQETETTGNVGSESDKKYIAWLAIEPHLANVDLRPYIFISKEKAIGFEAESTFPEHLAKLLPSLSGGSAVALRSIEGDLKLLTTSEISQLFSKLEIESRSADVKTLPGSIQGLLKLIEIDTTFEERLVNHIGTYPSANLGPWAPSQLTGLKTDAAKAARTQLLNKWAAQTENKPLKQTAGQLLKAK